MAIANMVLGLKELHIRGEIRTNVDYTVDILHVSAFTALVRTSKLIQHYGFKLHCMRNTKGLAYQLHGYVIIYVQAPEYRDNKIHTGWLDSRIAMRVRTERPPWEISVVGGALYVSFPYYRYLVL